MSVTKKIKVADDAIKHCPYCDNEIKAKAIKCQYCWEFLSKKEEKESKKNKSENYRDSTSALKSAIIAWSIVKRWCICLLVFLWISFFWWMFDWGFLETDACNVIDTLGWLCWLVLLMVRCNKAYKYLLNVNSKNLRFVSTWWPTWWRICPIACLFIPYQTVKDIYKSIEEKCWIVWWWWACMLISSMVMRLFEALDSESAAIVAVFWFWFIIARYILTLIIVNRVNEKWNIE